MYEIKQYSSSAVSSSMMIIIVLPMHWTHLPPLLKYIPALLLTQQSSAVEEGPPETRVSQPGSV